MQKLIVYISIVPVAIAQWHHYSIEVSPIVMDGLRLFDRANVAYPPHASIRRLGQGEHNVGNDTFMALFNDAIKHHDPDANAFGLLIIHNRKDVFDAITLDRIGKMLRDHPYIDPESVEVIHVVEGMPTSKLSLTLKEFIHQVHGNID